MAAEKRLKEDVNFDKDYDVENPPSGTEEPRIQFSAGKERDEALQKWQDYQKQVDAENGLKQRQSIDRELAKITRSRNHYIPLHKRNDVYIGVRLVAYANLLPWDHPDKIKYYFEALVLDPESSMALYQIANWYHRQAKDSYWAMHFYYRALCRQRNHCRAFLGLARIMFRRRHYDASIRCYRHAIFLARDPALSKDVQQQKTEFVPQIMQELDRAIKWYSVTLRQQQKGELRSKHPLITALLGNDPLFPTIRLFPPPPPSPAPPPSSTAFIPHISSQQ